MGSHYTARTKAEMLVLYPGRRRAGGETRVEKITKTRRQEEEANGAFVSLFVRYAHTHHEEIVSFGYCEPLEVLTQIHDGPLARMLRAGKATFVHSPRNVTLPLMPDTEMTELPPDPTFPAKWE